MLLDPFERRLALEKLLGQATIEWSADRQRRQTCGKGQERELHPDDLLKRKQTGPVRIIASLWRENSSRDLKTELFARVLELCSRSESWS